MGARKGREEARIRGVGVPRRWRCNGSLYAITPFGDGSEGHDTYCD
ncbi:hypothetical protein ACQKND_01140 [Viridibacillus arvi]